MRLICSRIVSDIGTDREDIRLLSRYPQTKWNKPALIFYGTTKLQSKGNGESNCP